MEAFNLEYQWKLYLQQRGLKEDEMPARQLQAAKQAFYGACGQMLLLLRVGLPPLDDEQGLEVLHDLLNQASNFWMHQN